MSAKDDLRAAANLMRLRARRSLSDITEQRWITLPALDPDNNGWVVAYDTPDADWDTTVAQLPYDYDGATALHLSGWHPSVALAVAEWLDVCARYLTDNPGYTHDGEDYALTVARAYLGGSA